MFAVMNVYTGDQAKLTLQVAEWCLRCKGAETYGDDPVPTSRATVNIGSKLTAEFDRPRISGMQTIHPAKRGGRRVGAGRPKGSGRYGEPTVPVRVPAKLAGEVEAFIRKAKRKLPLYIVGKPSEAAKIGS